MKALRIYTLILIVVLILLGSACTATKFVKEGCRSFEAKKLNANESRVFYVLAVNMCNPSGVILEENQSYKFEITARDLADGWLDHDITTPAEADGKKKPLGPEGFKSSDLNGFNKWVLTLAEYTRPVQSADANWFELVGTIGDTNKFFSLVKYTQRADQDQHQTHNTASTAYKADQTGELYCLVNDYPSRYGNNKGSFQVNIMRVSE